MAGVDIAEAAGAKRLRGVGSRIGLSPVAPGLAPSFTVAPSLALEPALGVGGPGLGAAAAFGAAAGYAGAPGLSGTTPSGWARPAASLAPRRRFGVKVAKYLLPLLGIALLSSIALWPEIARNFDHSRIVWRQAGRMMPVGGEMLRPRYRGLDSKLRPYTLSADTAERAGAERVSLSAPVGDLTLENGTWLMLRARNGVFMQHSNELDLSRDVTLYRQDGTTMTAATATMNLKQGAAASDSFTHAEGPFGTLDAQGFTMVDKGAVVQFRGPAKLVLNGAH